MKSTDFLKMPECMINEVPVYLSPNERDIYDTFREDMVINLKLMKLMQSTPLFFPANSFRWQTVLFTTRMVYHRIHDRKLDALEDLIEGANGKPVLIAYWYNHDLERICKRFDVRQIKTSKDIADWNSGNIPVAVIHPAPAGHGLNLQSGYFYPHLVRTYMVP